MNENFSNCFFCIVKSAKYHCVDCGFSIYRYTPRFVTSYDDLPLPERYQSIHFECLLDNEGIIFNLRNLYETPESIHGFNELSIKQKRDLHLKFS